MAKEIRIPTNLIDMLQERNIVVKDLVLYINSACNLRCKHCYVGNELLSKSLYYNTEDCCGVIKRLDSLDRLTIIGGEPFLHKGIVDIVNAGLASGVRDLRVTTNLTGMFYFRPSLLKSKDVTIAVSLDGFKAALHDKIRGRGRFQTTIDQIKYLIGSGIEVEVTHTVMSHNINYVVEFVELCRSLGIKKINFHKISLQGNASSERELYVSPEEWYQFRARIENIYPQKKLNGCENISIRVPVLYVKREEYVEMINSGDYKHHVERSFYSEKGGKRIVIYPDRKIYISSELFATESFIGSIENGNFIWNDRAVNEAIFFSKNVTADIGDLNSVFTDSANKYVPVSVSYKNVLCA